MIKNCWEIKKCGRQQGGINTSKLGVCPASEAKEYNGKNNGKFGGRYCWKIAGTLCGGKVQGSFASKIMNCSKCDFFHQVKEEEGSEFQV